MSCEVLNAKSPRPFKFTCKGSKQKVLIDALLRYSYLNLSGIALILNVSDEMVEGVYQEKFIFKSEQADNLSLLFLMFFSD